MPDLLQEQAVWDYGKNVLMSEEQFLFLCQNTGLNNEDWVASQV